MKIKYLLTILMGFTLIAIVVVASVRKETAASASRAVEGAVHTQAEALGSDEPGVGPIRNLRFTLFQSGIRPSEMRIKAGLVNILIEDRTKLVESVALRRVLGPERVAVGTIQRAVNHARGRSSFRLLPGEYELYDPNESTNKAVLLVEP